jgi:hypothetical protein
MLAHQFPLLPPSINHSTTSESVKNKEVNETNNTKSGISHLGKSHLKMKAEAMNPLQIPPAQAMVVGAAGHREPSASLHPLHCLILF